MLKPKKYTTRKFKGKLKKYSFKRNILKFGNLGIKAVKSGFISSKQLESSVHSIKQKVKKSAKIWVRIFPHTPITKKPIETRMGKGKGPISHYSAKIRAGNILIELFGNKTKQNIEILKAAKTRLPIKTKIIIK